MNRIYLDQGVVTLVGGVGRTSTVALAAPGAADALAHLADASFELVILGDRTSPILATLPVPVRTEPVLPSEPAHGSWLITDDPASCSAQPPGLRTILVGPKRAATNAPQQRCDMEARDLAAAVIEILAHDAMTAG